MVGLKASLHLHTCTCIYPENSTDCTEKTLLLCHLISLVFKYPEVIGRPGWSMISFSQKDTEGVVRDYSHSKKSKIVIPLSSDSQLGKKCTSTCTLKQLHVLSICKKLNSKILCHFRTFWNFTLSW